MGQLLRKPLFWLLWEQGDVPLHALLDSRVSAVAGDVSAPGLGLSNANWCRLASDVDTMIHCAASISFFDHIHTLLNQNYDVPSLSI